MAKAKVSTKGKPGAKEKDLKIVKGGKAKAAALPAKKAVAKKKK